MIKNNTYDQRMAKLGSLIAASVSYNPVPLDLDPIVRHIEQSIPTLTASLRDSTVGMTQALRAALTAWTNQDDDAHEMCSLVACRTPLHPGPCKGWKGTLHAVSPHIWRQMEEERVRKANERRVKRIADLRAQGKPIPRRMLAEIKPKPAPNSGPSGAHPANNVTPTPLGQVGQKADLTGGQAHQASQAINQAAGIKPNTANLPKGPKGKKPTVAGRGPAFVITQPKVTDTYKLDKAAKLTPQEWDGLSTADQKAIRDELEAIKQRGFGPQQTKADQLLAKLQPKPTLSATKTPAPAAPKAPSTPTLTPGKVSLGQATKMPAVPSTATQGPAASVAQAKSAIAITEAIHGPQATDVQKLAAALDVMKAQGDLKQQPKFRLLVDRLAQDALKKANADKMPGLGHGANDINITTINHAIRDHIADGKPGLPPVIQQIKDHRDKVKAGNAPTAPIPAVPGSTPKVFPQHVQHARAVAGRATGRPTSKAHLEAYGKLTKDDFDQLDANTQKTIRDDLANASAKFLDPKKKQEARDLLDRFGSRHPVDGGSKSANPSAPSVTPASPAPNNVPAPHPKGYSDPQDQAVKSASNASSDHGDVLRDVARLSPKQVNDLQDSDKRAITHRLAMIATDKKATDVQRQQAAAYGRIINSGSPVLANQADHKLSLGEIHRSEQVSGLHLKTKALDAAGDAKIPAPTRVAALGGMSKGQFDALTSNEQRKILNALHGVHRNTNAPGYTGAADDEAAAAITKYTGQHPAVHYMLQAEQDYKAGRINADQLHGALLTARVKAPPTTPEGQAAREQLDKEAARIAREQTGLPTHIRVNLAGEPTYGTKAYSAIGLARMAHMWDDAPRLSHSDIAALFRPTEDDLKAVDPIHAQAVRDLQQNVLRTGLKGQPGVPTGSPWSQATRDAATAAALGTSMSGGEMTRDGLARFKAQPDDIKKLIVANVRTQLLHRGDDHGKVETWLTLRELEGAQPLTGAERDALVLASKRYSTIGKMDAYRKLDPADFQKLPDFAQNAIKSDLDELHQKAVRAGAATPFTVYDNVLKLLPKAVDAHLSGARIAHTDRDMRNASGVAQYGADIIKPEDRVGTYNRLGPAKLDSLPSTARSAVTADLTRIEADGSLPLQTRYDAAMNGQVFLRKTSNIKLTVDQLSAAQAADPHPNGRYADAAALTSFSSLSKADYDGLTPTLREAIDERIKGLPGSDQQLLNAKFHPQAAAATPAGVVPTPATPGPIPPHVQAALDTVYGVHPKSHTMAHQLSTYGALKGADFHAFNPQEQQQLLSDLSFIATTAKGPSSDKAKKLIDRFTPPGTPSGQLPGNPAIIPPANAVPGQQRYATPLKGLSKAANSGKSGDGWLTLPGGRRVWGHYGAAGLLIKHTDPNSGEERYLMVQRGPAISDPGKWTFPGGASDSLETPHQGATRETIEELGLKDDQFKDALVHGDFTYSVPGSTWKYTTVAASVPTMFKPNLSTAHARAETSDAKWMTLDEIRALDKSGKLHHPIAGGQLEKNVISLYPSAGASAAGKLGQIARPGPVTKRPNRLTMPAGGRQAPANFNAWSKPHKESKGKNLVADKAAIDAMRQKVKQDRVLYDGKTADGRLAAIGAMQGFDDMPTVESKAEIDRLLATGDYIEAWRGVSGVGGWSARSRGGSGGKTAADINEEMRSGPAYYGKGIFGNGYYLATKRSVAQQYADGTHGSIMRILIPKAALTQTYDKVEKEAQANSSRMSKAKGAGYELSTFWDPGRWAAAKGLDGIEINPHHRAHGGGGASHVASPGKPAFNWLNRSVLIIQKEPG